MDDLFFETSRYRNGKIRKRKQAAFFGVLGHLGFWKEFFDPL